MQSTGWDSFVEDFGTKGEAIGNTMEKVLKNKGMALKYNSKDQELVILNSNKIAREALKDLFQGVEFKDWAPILINRIDSDGNQIVKLEANPGVICPFIAYIEEEHELQNNLAGEEDFDINQTDDELDGFLIDEAHELQNPRSEIIDEDDLYGRG